MAQFDNNDFAKYDYYKNGPTGPNIGQRQEPVGAIRGLGGPVGGLTVTNPSIAKQMEDLATELNMAFENVAALNTMLDPILGSAADLKSNSVAMEKQFDSESVYYQRMRNFVTSVMQLNDDLHKIRARIQL